MSRKIEKVVLEGFLSQSFSVPIVAYSALPLVAPNQTYCWPHASLIGEKAITLIDLANLKTGFRC